MLGLLLLLMICERCPGWADLMLSLGCWWALVKLGSVIINGS
jgi:hypothetical protein